MNIFDRLMLWCDNGTEQFLAVAVMESPQHLAQETSLHQCTQLEVQDGHLCFSIFLNVFEITVYE